MDSRHSSPERVRDEYSNQTGADRREPPLNRAEADNARWFTEDADFWHADGDVVLLLGGTGFKLHASRLAGYCGYFHDLFRPGWLMGGAVIGEADGCGVYPVPPQISLEGFKHLLKVIESPFDHITNPLSQEVAISLLVAAVILSCGYGLDLARKRLCEIWGGQRPPPIRPSDHEDRTIYSAVRAVNLGRQYAMPGVLKRAFYELLSNRTFVRKLESAVDDLPITKEDAHLLLAARLKLGRLWRNFIADAPSGAWRVSHQAPCSAHRCCHAGDSKEARAGKWRNLVCERGLLEVVDPIRFDLVREWRNAPGGKKWCRGCLENKRRAWEEKRVRWWKAMDGWFGL